MSYICLSAAHNLPVYECHLSLSRPQSFSLASLSCLQPTCLPVSLVSAVHNLPVSESPVSLNRPLPTCYCISPVPLQCPHKLSINLEIKRYLAIISTCLTISQSSTYQYLPCLLFRRLVVPGCSPVSPWLPPWREACNQVGSGWPMWHDATVYTCPARSAMWKGKTQEVSVSMK